MAAIVWKRSPDDFATRIDIEDLTGLLQRDVVVEMGTQAIILVDGRSEAGTLGPDRYKLRSHPMAEVLGRAQTRTALLVDIGAVRRRFRVEPRLARPMIAELDIMVRLGDPIKFFINLMHGAPHYTLTELEAYLQPVVRDAVREAVRGKQPDELCGDLALKRELATSITVHLDETQTTVGLKFEGVMALDFI